MQHLTPFYKKPNGRYVSPFSTLGWRTYEGSRFILATMETSHLFFAFRMLYDRIAAREGWPTVREPGVGRQAATDITDKRAALYLAAFATDIECRGDLPEKYQTQFNFMLNMLRPMLPEARKQLGDTL